MLDPAHEAQEPLDSCLALAVWQASALLPDDPELADAAEVLVVEYEKFQPDLDEIHSARLAACRALDRMTDKGIGGALAVLLLEWLRSRGG